MFLCGYHGAKDLPRLRQNVAAQFLDLISGQSQPSYDEQPFHELNQPSVRLNHPLYIEGAKWRGAMIIRSNVH